MAKSKSATAKKSFTPKEKKTAYVNFSQKVHVNFVKGFQGEEAVTPNFEYTLTIQNGVSISLLDINGTVVSPIKSNDKVFAERTKPFYIEIRAQLNGPTGGASFQLKDIQKDKDVFTTPQELQFSASGNGGLFLDDVKLP